MADLMKLLVPFALVPRDYPEVLQKLTAFMFYELMLIQMVIYNNTALGAELDEIATFLGLHQVAAALSTSQSFQLIRFHFCITSRSDLHYVYKPLLSHAQWDLKYIRYQVSVTGSMPLIEIATL